MLEESRVELLLKHCLQAKDALWMLKFY
jgi:hypothetical protein